MPQCTSLVRSMTRSLVHCELALMVSNMPPT